MSLQPCLPLPPSRSRKRRRDRQQRGDDNAADSNDNNDGDYGDMNNTAGSTMTMMSGKQRIEDLGAMSAMEFIGRVHEEARGLGDVFVAAAAGGGDGAGANSGNDGDGNNGQQTQEDGEDEYDEEEEGEIAEPVRDATASSSLTTAGTTGNSCASASASTTKQPLPSNNVGISGSLAYLLSHRTDLPRPPSAAHLPASAYASASSSSSWIDATLYDFSKLRLYLDACVEGQIGSKKQPGSGVGSNSSSSRMPVPPMRAREDWHVFCLGRDEAQGYYQDDDHDEDDDEESNMMDGISTKKMEPWRDNIPAAGHPPSTALLCQMDQVMVRRVLAHHVSYVCDGVDGGGEEVGNYNHTTYAMTTSRARWLYGLLARLAKPLHRDDAAMLRRLLRECCIRRAGIRVGILATRGGDDNGDGTIMKREGGGSRSTGSNSGVVSILNTLIAIVGIYFEQGTTDELFSL